MRLIRCETYLKYARMKVQEAENALQEEDVALAVSRCRDAALCLLKGLAASSSRWRDHDIDAGVDGKLVKRIVSEVADQAGAGRLAEGMVKVLSAGENLSRIEAEQLLSLTGELFSQVHASLYPG